MCKADELRPVETPRLPAEICRRCVRFVRPVSIHGQLHCPHCHSFVENSSARFSQRSGQPLVSTG